MNYTAITGYLWLVLFSYWLIAALHRKKTVYRQSFVSQWLISTGLGCSFTLVYFPDLSIGVLGRQLAPHTPIWGLAGVLCCGSGVGFAIWARLMLGRNWSGVVTLKEDHELIRRGPYRYVRHPIYSGFLLGLFGATLTVGLVRAALGTALLLAVFLYKIHKEERLLSRQFPEDYAAYRRQVKALVPFVI